MGERLKLGLRNKIVKGDGIALFVNALAQRDEVGGGLNGFQNFNNDSLPRQTQVHSIAEQAMVEIEEGLLAAQDILKSYRKQRAGDHLPGGRRRVRAVELIARGVGAV